MVIIHKAWVRLMDGTTQTGYLYSVHEDGIKITLDKSFDVINLITIDASTIQQLKIRRKGNVGRGVWIGAVTGASVGALLGYVSGDDGWFSKEAIATGGGIFGAVVGSGIGALIGTSRKYFKINGNITQYLSQLEVIRSYSLTPNSLE